MQAVVGKNNPLNNSLFKVGISLKCKRHNFIIICIISQPYFTISLGVITHWLEKLAGMFFLTGTVMEQYLIMLLKYLWKSKPN